MKIFFITILSIFLLVKPQPQPEHLCDMDTIILAVPPVIWYEQSIDGHSQHPTMTRIIHNKVSIFSTQFAKCYANFVDPVEIYKSIGPTGLIFWAYFIYEIARRRSLLLLGTSWVV